MAQFFLKILLSFGAGLMISHLGIAGTSSSPWTQKLESLLGAQYPGAKITVLNSSELPTLNAMEEIQTVHLGRVVPTGQTEVFALTSTGRNLSGIVRYEARIPTYVALRRIRPGERLTKDDFQIQEVNVAQGMNYEYRGVMVSKGTPLDQYEAKQTILQGQYPLRTGIQRVPDVKRGDIVQVRLVAGSIHLSTTGQAQEPGYKDSLLRVLTTKTKKELSGIVQENGVVEVQL